MVQALSVIGTQSLGALRKIPIWVWAVLALIIGVIFFARHQFKKGEEKALAKIQKKEELPNAGSGIPTEIGPDGQAKSWDPQPLAEQLLEVMQGKDWWVWGDQEYVKRAALGAVAVLTTDQLVALWNHFNTMPAVLADMEDYGNLRNWMEDDSWYGDPNYTKVKVKMDALGLFPKSLT